ncbi:MAG: hypothetical protein OXM55_07795 [Bdellovibrionales bacterium]|nr:hypothetical protein [Bdellovibrionales bacterium]
MTVKNRYFVGFHISEKKFGVLTHIVFFFRIMGHKVPTGNKRGVNMDILSPIGNIVLGAGSSIVLIVLFFLKSSWRIISDFAKLKAEVCNLKENQKQIRVEINQIRSEIFPTIIQKIKE